MKNLLALGRLKTGVMNKTEARYDARLKTLQHAREIAWHRFEAIKLRLADNTFYTPDFVVMRSDGIMEIHEVKGAKAIFRDDARVKIKVAASQYPFRFLAAYPRKTGGWEFEEF